MLSRSAQRFVGIAVIAAAILVVLLVVLKPNPFAFERTYWAEMDSAQGLGATGRDVRVAGLNVGKIGKVERRGDDARVEIVLRQDVKVHSDAAVNMRPHLLFEGSSFIDLHPGSPSAPLLRENATIPRPQTTNYVTLDEALRILRPQIREQLAQLAGIGALTMRGAAVTGVQRTLRAAPRLTRSLKRPVRELQGPRRRELAGTIAGASRTVDAVARSERELIPMFQRLSHTVAGMTPDGGAPLDATLAELPAAVRSLYDAAPPLTRMIDSLDVFAAEIRPGLPEFAAALHALRPVLHRAPPALRRATPVLREARFVATGLSRADALTEMFKLIPEPLGRLGETLKLLQAKSRYGQPAYRQLGAAFAGMAGAVSSYKTPSQGPSGRGHGLRVSGALSIEAIGGLGYLGARRDRPDVQRARTRAPCEDVLRISARAARELRTIGACR